jgi:hypothetical protein
MSAPKVTAAVLEDPDVLELRETAEAAMRDWLDAVARTAVDKDVREPDDVLTYLAEQQERLWEYASPIERTEQDVFLWLGSDYDEWRDYNRSAA